jgi:site-specific recombinase XerD
MGQLIALETDKSTTGFDDVLVSWVRALRGENKSPQTIRAYRLAVEALVAYLHREGMPTSPAAVTGEHVRAFLTDQTERNSASTAKSRYAFLRVFWNWLVDDGEIKVSPMARIKPPAVEDRLPDDLDDDAFEAMLRTTQGKGFEARRDRAILMLLADTGLRRAECASLRMTDLDLDADPPYAKVMGKGRKERIVVFRPETATAIDTYVRRERKTRAMAGRPELWLGRAGALTGIGIGDVVSRRARQAGLSDVHAHLLRHRWAHRRKASGMPEEDIMALGGWASREIMARYGRSNTTRRAIASAKTLMAEGRW